MTEKLYKRNYSPEALEAMRAGGSRGGKKSKPTKGLHTNGNAKEAGRKSWENRKAKRLEIEL